MLTGRCLCGTCTYAIEGEPAVVAHCHCLDCQRLGGAGHTSGAVLNSAGMYAADPALILKAFLRRFRA